MLTTCALLWMVLAPQGPEALPVLAASPVKYTIQPVTAGDLVELRIVMAFRGDPSGGTAIRLPRDKYGTPRLHEFVRDVRAEGATLAAGGHPDQRILSHDPGAVIELRYTVAFDPSAREGSAYRPSVGPAHFHFLGPQWMARIDGEAELQRDFTFAFRTVPEGWTRFGSFGVGPGTHRLRASFEGLVETVLGGGDYSVDEFEAEGGRVHTFVKAGFEVGTQALFAAVRKIVTYQQEFFGDEVGEPFVVTLTPRDGITAGTSIRNAMICYADPDGSLIKLSKLLAHEMFHQWLPNRGRVQPVAFEKELDWMDEGFTEYFARRLLLDQGLATGEQFNAWFEGDFGELRENPHRAMTNAELGEVHRSGTFTNVHYRLSYLRGALIALNWDTRIRAGGEGRSLADAVRQLVDRAAKAGGALPQDDFHELMGRYGIDSRTDVGRWIERAEPIALEAGWEER